MDRYAKGVRWDLSDLYASHEDPNIEKDLTEAAAKARAFVQAYKSRFESGADASLPLAGILSDYKAIQALLAKSGVYAYLSFAENTLDAARGAFLQKIKVRLTDISTDLLFFEVGWNRLPEETAQKLIADPAAAPDRHFLEKLRAFAPHTLSEAEEKILSVKSNTSAGAFVRLYDESLGAIPFFLDWEGRREKKTESEILSLLHSPDRNLRRKSSESLADGLRTNSRILTYIYNMILADHRAMMKIRGYRHPMDERNLSNETDLESILNLMQKTKEAYPLAQRYYRLKADLLGLDTLRDYDRYATLNPDETHVSFDRCRNMVLEGYRAFSAEAGAVAEQFFSKRWIDAEIREGKQGGGFCCHTTPELHPYVLVNYTGSLRDVMTVAHELGHGLHQYLARQAGILEQDAPLTMAEMASVFGEMLIFEKILGSETDDKKRLALLCGKIDDQFATVFRQIAITDFELRAHAAGLEKGELSEENLSDLWMDANRAFYGDSVELTENYRQGWKTIPHVVHTPFYCYAYAFAQLFVLCLYQRYKEEGEGFVPKYFRMLALGGSKKPEDIARIAGLDLKNPGIWDEGLRLLEKWIEEAEHLAAVLPSKST